MSRANHPKQLIPLIGSKSLLRGAVDRLEGLIPYDQLYICAGEAHRRVIGEAVTELGPDQYLGEPTGRDTLNAVGFAAAVIERRDPEAVIAVFTADHVIEPVDVFQRTVEQGFELAEAQPGRLVTFGITPTRASTAYGYLELGRPLGACDACLVEQFKEKPDAPAAKHYYDRGRQHYLWNSGMFVWRSSTLLACIEKFAPANHEQLMKIAEAHTSDERQTIATLYPTLNKISVDYAVMEPASQDPAFEVVAIPMPVTWLDIGSWTAFSQTCLRDKNGNSLAAAKHALLDTGNTLVASNDDEHLIATIGCRDLVVIHTPDATLVCTAAAAEQLKELHQMIGQEFGSTWL